MDVCIFLCDGPEHAFTWQRVAVPVNDGCVGWCDSDKNLSVCQLGRQFVCSNVLSDCRCVAERSGVAA